MKQICTHMFRQNAYVIARSEIIRFSRLCCDVTHINFNCLRGAHRRDDVRYFYCEQVLKVLVHTLRAIALDDLVPPFPGAADEAEVLTVGIVTVAPVEAASGVGRPDNGYPVFLAGHEKVRFNRSRQG